MSLAFEKRKTIMMHVDFRADGGGKLDRRLGLAAAILISAHQKESGSA